MTAGAPLLSRLGLALLCLLLLPSPSALAVAEAEVTSPEADSDLDGPFEVVVVLRPDDGEVIERVDARVVGSSGRTVALQPDGPPGEDGTQVWRGPIDPLDGLALANGGYRITATATPLVGDPAPIDGPSVQLVVPPPQRELEAEPAPEDATTVSLAWDPVALPDFIAYRIQRRPDAEDGTWATVLDVEDPRTGSASEVVDEPGAYRYRLVVVRSDGRGGELFATSDPRGVHADPDDPGTFDAPRDPDPVPSNTPSPAPSPTDGTPSTAQPTPTSQPTPTPGPGAGVPTTPRPPSVGGEPPRAAPPAVASLDDGSFEEILPFEVPEAGIEVIETESAFIGGGSRTGGTLAVLTEEAPDRAMWTATAGGLLLLVVSAHVQRFLSGGGGRSARLRGGRMTTGRSPSDG